MERQQNTNGMKWKQDEKGTEQNDNRMEREQCKTLFVGSTKTDCILFNGTYSILNAIVYDNNLQNTKYSWKANYSFQQHYWYYTHGSTDEVDGIWL